MTDFEMIRFVHRNKRWLPKHARQKLDSHIDAARYAQEEFDNNGGRMYYAKAREEAKKLTLMYRWAFEEIMALKGYVKAELGEGCTCDKDSGGDPDYCNPYCSEHGMAKELGEGKK